MAGFPFVNRGRYAAPVNGVTTAPTGSGYLFNQSGGTTFVFPEVFGNQHVPRFDASDKLSFTHTGSRITQACRFDIFANSGADVTIDYGSNRITIVGSGNGALLASHFDLPASNPTPPAITDRWGASIVGFGTGSFTYPNWTVACQKLKAMGFSWVRIIPIWSMDTVTANVVEYTAGIAHTDAETIAAIRIAKLCGLRVSMAMGLLFPNSPGGFPAQINPSNPSAWFTSYQAAILHWAAIAQAEGLDIFSVGQEMSLMQVIGYSSNWSTLVTAVRGVFSGTIIYCSDGVNDAPGVFPHVDVIGFDPYVSLSATESTDVGTLTTAFTNNILTPISALATSYSKQAMISEIGYQSLSDCMVSPFGGTGSISDAAQDACYAAMKAAIDASGAFLKYIWLWDFGQYNSALITKSDYSVYGKTAAARVDGWF